MKTSRNILLIAAGALLAAVPAAGAHVSITSNTTAAGSYAGIVVNIPHGCDDAATNRIEMKLPDGITSITPGRTAFWTPEVKMRKLDTPVDAGHGKKVSEVPDTVTWTASTPLPNGQLDQIPATIKLPEKLGQLNFPIIQGCVGGKETAWTQIASGDEEPELPAATIVVTKAEGDGHGGAADADADDTDGASVHEASSSKELDKVEDAAETAKTIAYVGVALGALGLLFGLVAMRRRRG